MIAKEQIKNRFRSIVDCGLQCRCGNFAASLLAVALIFLGSSLLAQPAPDEFTGRSGEASDDGPFLRRRPILGDSALTYFAGRPTAAAGGRKSKKISRTFDLFQAPTVAKKADPAAAIRAGTCVAILDTQQIELEIACSHQHPAPKRVHLVSIDPCRRASPNSEVVCDLGEPASPIVDFCRLNPEQYGQVKAGNAVVWISLNRGTFSAIVGKLPAFEKQPDLDLAALFRP